MIIYKVREDGVYEGAEEYPDSPVIPKGYTFSEPPQIPAGYYAVMGPNGWQLVQGEKPVYPPYSIEEYNQQRINKELASELLYKTDWTTIPDITDPAKSTPYLINQDEFIAYRNVLRGIAVYPTANAVFPEEPKAIWSNA